MKKTLSTISILILFIVNAIQGYATPPEVNFGRAQATLDSIYKHYSVAGTPLLRENYPFTSTYTATYLATQQPKNVPNPYAYLWPFSGTLSALSALYEASSVDNTYLQLLNTKVIAGLNHYLDKTRLPVAYASYINTAPLSDRFYDDNVWLGIDYADLYNTTHEERFIDTAKLIWAFVESGIDDKLGGGIYWCEQKKHSKNTCSNAPGAVFALKLFRATNDSVYFKKGVALYNWTKQNLQDKADNLYFDNIGLSGKVDKTKYAYNSGQMLQAAALLYKLTGNIDYLSDAKDIAESAYNYFFTDVKTPKGKTVHIVKPGNVWFTAVMLRGFIELYSIDDNNIYLNAFQQSLDYAWEYARTPQGLFYDNFSVQPKKNLNWLLTQAAMVEMYARMSAL